MRELLLALCTGGRDCLQLTLVLNTCLCRCSQEGVVCARLYTKGAPELLLRQCSSRLADGASIEHLSEAEKDNLLQSFAADGNRCLLAFQHASQSSQQS